jgi:AraC-like DNA-binding protein
MEYVEYFRILKAIELTYYMGEKKVCYKVGYKYHSSFCRSFFKVTKLNVSYFSPDKFKENKKVAEEVRKLAKENPKKAVGLILNDVSKRYMLLK